MKVETEIPSAPKLGVGLLFNRVLPSFVAEQPEPKNYVCYGTLLSREQYLYDITDLNYADARIPPVGRMTPHDIEIWQAAIGER